MNETNRWILFVFILFIMSLIAHSGWLNHVFFLSASFLGCIAIYGMRNNRWPGDK